MAEKTKLKLLNLGCGSRYHADWTNVDVAPVSAEIIKCDLIKGIPFPDNSFDVVYHSHVLEHFSKKDGEFFIGECFRVLKNEGFIRVVLPDLEKIAKEYLNNLERTAKNEHGAKDDYDWILLEMYDQTVRNYSGGEMGNYLLQDKIPNENYVLKRVGKDVLEWRKTFLESKNCFASGIGISYKIKKIIKNLLHPERLIFTKAEKQYISIGKFRSGGEIHQWMYDRFSLRRLLMEKGFENIIVQTATDSLIPDWINYQLDNPDETASLFMEAIKRS